MESIIPYRSFLDALSLRSKLENNKTKIGEESTIITLDAIVVNLNEVIQQAKCKQRNKPAVVKVNLSLLFNLLS